MKRFLGVVMLFVVVPALLLAQSNSPADPVSQANRSGAVAGTGTKALENQLVDNEKRLANAEKQKDHTFMKQALADDFIYVAYNGEVFTKDKIVQSLKYLDIRQYQMENFKVRTLGRDAALLTYDLRVSGNVAGHNLPQKQYASSVWVRKGANWILVFHQETPAHHS